jgi:predicted SAM-dependent methyltransferase
MQEKEEVWNFLYLSEQDQSKFENQRYRFLEPEGILRIYKFKITEDSIFLNHEWNRIILLGIYE